MAKATLKRQIELDFVRGVALLMVMVYHYQSHNVWLSGVWAERVQEAGWAGVDLFFVLSGYLVGGLLMREWKMTGDVDGWRFLKRRAFKIWPSYYLLIFVAAAIHLRPLRSFFWQNLLNIQNYVPSTLSHTWSLAVEEHFYLMAAAVLALWSSRRWRPRALIWMCVGVALVVEVARAYAAAHQRPYYFYTHLRGDALLLGVVLAALEQFEPEMFRWLRGQRWLLAGVALLAFARLVYDPDYEHSASLVTVVDWGCAAGLLLLSRPAHKRRNIAYRAVARLGLFSYGIYLWHISVLRPTDWVIEHAPRGVAPSVSVLLPYAGAIAVGVVMTKLVEAPFLRLRERVVAPRTPEVRVPFA